MLCFIRRCFRRFQWRRRRRRRRPRWWRTRCIRRRVRRRHICTLHLIEMETHINVYFMRRSQFARVIYDYLLLFIFFFFYFVTKFNFNKIFLRLLPFAPSFVYVRRFASPPVDTGHFTLYLVICSLSLHSMLANDDNKCIKKLMMMLPFCRRWS